MYEIITLCTVIKFFIPSKLYRPTFTYSAQQIKIILLSHYRKQENRFVLHCLVLRCTLCTFVRHCPFLRFSTPDAILFVRRWLFLHFQSTQIFPTYVYLPPLLEETPLESDQDLWRQKTRVPGLLCGLSVQYHQSSAG